MISKHDICLYRNVPIGCDSVALELERPTWRGEDIWEKLRSQRTFIVDNNVSPKKLAGLNCNMNFVIGATRTDECEDLNSELCCDIPLGGYPNLFKVDIREDVVVFHRLDERYREIYKACIPRASEFSQSNRHERHVAAQSFRSIVQNFLTLDGVLVGNLIRNAREHCRGNIEASALLAAATYALFILKSSKQRRSNLLNPSYLNFSNDARLIAEALCFGFGIASNDLKDVHVMAEIAGVSACSESQFITSNQRLS